MGARGPSPTPTTTLKLRGSWRGDDRTGEPESPVAAPPCPAFLKGEAATEWKRIVPLLLKRRTLSEADRAMLAGYCQAWGEFSAAAKGIDELVAGKKHEGHVMDHPRVVMGRAFERMLKAADRFGLSPAAKARVRAEGSDSTNKDGKSRFFPSGPAVKSG